MSKLVYFILFISFFCFCGLFNNSIAYADEGQVLQDGIQELLNGLDVSALDAYLQQYKHGLHDLFQYGSNAKEIISYFIDNNYDINFFGYLQEIVKIIVNQIIYFIPLFVEIIVITILSSIIQTAKGSVISENIGKIASLVCNVIIIILITNIIITVIRESLNCVSIIKLQMEVISPLLVTLSILTGGHKVAGLMQPISVFMSQGIVSLMQGFLIPATTMMVVLHCISALHSDFSFTGASVLIKSICKWIIGILLTVFSIFLGMQGISNSLFDGILFKTTKYIIGNSVPIVGGFLSGGVETIVYAGSMIKNSIGGIGILIVIIQFIKPLCVLAGFTFMLKLIASIAQPLGDKNLYQMFQNLSSDIDQVIATLLVVVFMYIMTIMMVLQSSSYFI